MDGAIGSSASSSTNCPVHPIIDIRTVFAFSSNGPANAVPLTSNGPWFATSLASYTALLDTGIERIFVASTIPADVLTRTFS